MSGRVLLVEDESIVALLIEDMLVDLGYEVVEIAARLDRALVIVERGGFDLAVLDVNLGGNVRSFPIADQLRAQRIPFVFVTGYDRSALGQEHVDVPLVRKPFLADELARALQAARTEQPAG